MHSELVISHADRRPMYLQIVEQIRRRIAVGDWAPGQEIPSIRTLAATVQVSGMGPFQITYVDPKDDPRRD